MRKYEILPTGIILDNESKPLSRREMEVLILVAAGLENSQIAKLFRVTLSTVKKQLERIYYKLKARNRANAVFIAQQENIISQRDYKFVINLPVVSEVIQKNRKYY